MSPFSQRRCCTSNLRALYATFLLNTAFTLAQFFGARSANSLSLMSDTGIMFVDSATYAVNIAAEYYKERLGARNSKLVECLATLVSAATLLGVTGYLMKDALARLQPGQPASDVNPAIMLVFTSVNLLVDFGMCGSIAMRRTGGIAGCISRSARCSYTSGSKRGDQAEARDGRVELDDRVQLISTASELNLCSAFAHVIADTMRTLTVMTCALLVAVADTDPLSTDAVGSLLVCAIILVISAYLFYEGTVQLRAYRKAAGAAPAPSADPAFISRYPAVVEDRGPAFDGPRSDGPSAAIVIAVDGNQQR